MNLTKILEETPYFSGEELKKYFLSHVQVYPKKSKMSIFDVSMFYEVYVPIYAFKSLKGKALAFLEIPVGAVVHAGYDLRTGDLLPSNSSWKLRASKARVHKIVSQKGKNRTQGRSTHNRNFQYFPNPGRVIKPVGAPFSFEAGECKPGIHFFLNLKDAWKY